MKSGKEVVIAINKVDSKQAEENIYDFYELGFDAYIPISGEHNRGIADLLEVITKDFKEDQKEKNETTKICVIGRPNVGKSSLVNALLKENRLIVSDVAGTTRDSVDIPFKYNKENYILIDTAGMRKKGKIFEQIEKYSLLRSIRAIDRADICILVINREEGIIEHDKHIAGYAIEKGKGIIIVVNKWDTVEDKENDIKDFSKKIKDEFQFIPYAPIVFLSALTKKRLHTLMPEVEKVNQIIKKYDKNSILKRNKERNRENGRTKKCGRVLPKTEGRNEVEVCIYYSHCNVCCCYGCFACFHCNDECGYLSVLQGSICKQHIADGNP